VIKNVISLAGFNMIFDNSVVAYYFWATL